ncbi:hypothetical protein O9G_001190 [Rozella allomycis CSF55]|uniref:Uncharacterized protein n=1 Tax=Rozella allomycis (strain CSF55) TaxID=988480 RepID=A0A075ASG1_ROZAC|nr:hypothetical protein O9G_001190 [Rozella allomycis CSF55]|eukprot:EPZ33221.1 hypothetical protein O9G_001190 [Rozella allomycis CSF55]
MCLKTVKSADETHSEVCDAKVDIAMEEKGVCARKKLSITISENEVDKTHFTLCRDKFKYNPRHHKAFQRLQEQCEGGLEVHGASSEKTQVTSDPFEVIFLYK